jgi:16S rRNA (adenine1518-N6/adenine1519-N6)-dimethyltransferase
MQQPARKRFGQHFLIDRSVVAAILAAISPRAGDKLIEIGPGPGALTRPLLQQVDRLRVVEIDRDIVARLRGEFPQDRLIVHEGDALRYDFGALGDDLRLVGNLPYNISTPLLFHLATFSDKVRDMHFMLQKEVVDRMVAAPGGAQYSRLSVMLQYRFRMECLLRVPPEAFRPRPKVASAVVRLLPRPREELDAKDDALMARVVRQAFSQRRKMLRNTLRGVMDETGLDALGIAPSRRAEELAVSDYVRICNALAVSK